LVTPLPPELLGSTKNHLASPVTGHQRVTEYHTSTEPSPLAVSFDRGAERALACYITEAIEGGPWEWGPINTFPEYENDCIHRKTPLSTRVPSCRLFHPSPRIVLSPCLAIDGSARPSSGSGKQPPLPLDGCCHHRVCCARALGQMALAFSSTTGSQRLSHRGEPL